MVFIFNNNLCQSGGVALGDIHATPGPCSSIDTEKGLCDFESGTCNWDARGAWKRVRATSDKRLSDASILSGPPFLGYCLLLDSTNSMGVKGSLASPVWSARHQPRLLEFWYIRDRSRSANLWVELQTPSGASIAVIWQLPTTAPGLTWNLGRVEIPVRDEDFKVAIQGTAGRTSNYRTLLAVDDVRLSTRSGSHVANCNFEGDLCGYASVAGSDPKLRWFVGSGRVRKPSLKPTVPALPLVGLSEGLQASKTFAYVDTTVPLQSNSKISNATLRSAVFTARENDTLLLRYFRKGNATESFLVYQSKWTKGEDKITWVTLGSLQDGDDWQDFEAPLQAADESQLHVVITRSSNQLGFAAVASISVGHARAIVREKPEQTVDCNFENATFCNWKPDSTGGSQLEWKLNDPQSRQPAFPSFDSTTRSYKGKYIYAESNKSAGTEAARLKSPAVPTEWLKSMCFSFWYFSVADVNSSLSVSLSSASDAAWHSSVSRLTAWTHGQTQFEESAPQEGINIILEASIQNGLVAVDDLSATPGPCSATQLCSFEGGVDCSLESDIDNVRDWTVVDGSGLGVRDHSTDSTAGHFLYLNTTYVEQKLHSFGRIFLPERDATEATCLTFWWRAVGADSVFNVYNYRRGVGLRDPVLSFVTRENPWWNARSITLSSEKTWQAVFEVLLPELALQESSIFLDDIELISGFCRPENYCSFETPTCLHWKNSDEDSTSHWSLERAGLSVITRDHTLQSKEGHYLLFRGDRPQKRASLVLTDRRYHCATMWHYISEAPANLTITAGDVRFAKSTGGQWKEAMFPVDIKNAVVSAIAGGHSDAFAAIDDLLLIEERCYQQPKPAPQPFVCAASGQKVPAAARCNFIADCSDGSDEVDCGACTFENGTCGWSVEGRGLLRSDDFSWQRQKAATPVGGPLRDHTTSSSRGHYLLLRAKQPIEGMTVIGEASSPVLHNTGHLCVVKFWFNYRASNDTHVFLLELHVNGFQIVAWDSWELAENPSEGKWNEGQFLLGRYRSPVQIYLRGYEAPRDDSYTAIDDISFEGCDMPVPSVEQNPGMFTCKNKVSIVMEHLCDYTDHCGDFSDEEDCEDFRFRCSFDSSFCDWTPAVSTRGGGWTRSKPFKYLTRGPTRDHTSGGKDGSFLYLKSEAKSVSASLLGPVFNATTLCVMRFYFVVKASTNAVLSVKTRNNADGEFKEVWRSDQPTEFRHFTEAFVAFREASDFQVSIEGSLEGDRDAQGYIAIDDVTFLNSCHAASGPLPKSSPDTSTPAPSNCTNGHFACLSGDRCIPASQLCDFLKQCPDGSDESHCGACDFSTDLCGLEGAHSQSQPRWSRVSALMVSNNRARFPSLPREDSGHSERGFYVTYLKTDGAVPKTDRNTALMTPPLGAMGHACRLTFYSFLPKHTKTLHLSVAVVERSRDQKNKIIKKSVLLARGDEDQAAWEMQAANIGNRLSGARIYYSGSENVSIDDIEYHHCHPDDAREDSVNCTFEEKEGCGWYPENVADSGDWKVISGAPFFAVADHTTGQGMYLALENFEGTTVVAHMVSARLNATGEAGRCFRMWYHMHGDRNSRLNLRLFNVSNTDSNLWTRSGHQGDTWMQAAINIKVTDAPFQLLLEGELPSYSPSFIGVDDISFDERPCPPTLTCNFEEGPCDWTLEGWKLDTGGSFKAVPTDHTAGTSTGHFARLERRKGRILSAKHDLSVAERRCFRFWHFFTGQREQTLSVYKHTAESAETPELVWAIHGEDRPPHQWLSGSVNVAVNESSSLRLELQGENPEGNVSALAVDDLLLSGWACPRPGSCSFEDDLCDWSNVAGSSDLAWQRWSGPTPDRSGPAIDHTLGSRHGHFLFLSAERAGDKRVGIIESELLHYSPRSCLQFYYFVDPKGSQANLSVQYARSGKVFRRIGVLAKGRSAGWQLFRSLQSWLPAAYNIRISGYPGDDEPVDVAIDDIEVFDRDCPGNMPADDTPVETRNSTFWDCDFDMDFCSWSQSGNTWIIRSGRTAILTGDGPHTDSKLRTLEGKYAYFSPQPSSPSDMLTSAALAPSRSDYCVQFWYFLYSLAPTQLVIGLVNAGTLCDFEGDGYCGFLVDSSGGGRWRIAGGNSDPVTLSSQYSDHTFGASQGTYVYLDGRNSSGEGTYTGILKSQLWRGSSAYCFSFWLYMRGTVSGPSTSSLRVIVAYDQNEKEKRDALAVFTGSQGKRWTRKRVTLKPPASAFGEFRVLLAGTTGVPGGGDIAVDDVEVIQGACDPNLEVDKFKCHDGVTFVNISQVCDFKKDCPGSGDDEQLCGQCDFDVDTCGWYSKDDWKWTIAKDNEHNSSLPMKDQSRGDEHGGYVYSSGRGYLVEGGKLFHSPNNTHRLKRSGKDCTLSFWYFASGRSNQLSVHKYTLGYDATLWLVEKDGLQVWTKERATIGRSKSEFDLAFEASSGFSAADTFVAIDTISFENCALPAPSPKNCSGPNRFSCPETNVCISKNQLCDHVDDCGDGSDEVLDICQNYTICSYEPRSDPCTWKAASAESERKSLEWRVSYVPYRKGDPNTGPYTDHTMGGHGSGRVLLLRPLRRDDLNSSAFYRSPNYIASNGECSLTFHYYLHGQDVGGIALFAQYENYTEKPQWKNLFEAKGQRGQRWILARAVVQDDKPFCFIIEGSLGTGYASDIAIDDISVSPGCISYNDTLPNPAPPPMPKCKASQYACRNGGCIPNQLVCDFEEDCADGSDEEMCGPCSFEYGTCGWTDVSSGKVTWQVKQARYVEGPKIDHTTKSAAGHLLALNNDEYFASTAVVLSPQLPPSSSRCSMSFWYYYSEVFNAAAMDVRYLLPQNYSVKLVEVAPAKAWTKLVVNIPRRETRDARIAFYANVTELYRMSSIGIDDISFMNCRPSSLFIDCSFDNKTNNNGLCHWQNTGKSSNGWQVKFPGPNHDGVGPTADHTSGRGGYAIFSAEDATQTASLESAETQPSAKNVSCLTFWYSMNNGNSLSLLIEAKTMKNSSVKFTRETAARTGWNFGELPVSLQEPYTVTISAIKAKKAAAGAFIAMDDIVLTEGPCRRTGFCDFETDFCDWKLAKIGLGVGWRRISPATETATGPAHDHTLGTSDGHYAVVTHKRQGDKATLSSPVFENTGNRCLRYWFNMAGNSIGTLSVYQRLNGSSRIEDLKPVWKRSGDHKGAWRRGHVKLRNLRRFQVVIEAFAEATNAEGSSYVALDDLEFSLEPCEDTVTCNFETDTCGWYTDGTSSNIPWIRTTGSAGVYLGGPGVDVTTSSAHGNYLLAEFGNRSELTEMVLLSDYVDVQHQSSYCFSLWYISRNGSESSLLVKSVKDGDARSAETLGNLTQRTTWTKQAITVLTEEEDQRSFQIVALPGRNSDLSTPPGVAVDEVGFFYGSCDGGTKPPASNETALRYPPHPLDCDFEDDDCAWANGSTSSRSVWVRKFAEGHGDVELVLPETDHTTKSVHGSFAYLGLTSTAGSQRPFKEDIAILESEFPLHVSDGGACLKFWFFAFGSDVAPLVLKERDAVTRASRVAWTNAWSRGPQWNYAQVHLEGDKAVFLGFESSKTPGGHTALDDISVNTGQCPRSPYCDFEADDCGWRVRDGTEQLRWERMSASSTTGGSDHTLGSADGHVLAVNTSSPDAYKGMTVTTFSQTQEAGSSSCVRFWYQLSSGHKLSVGTIEGAMERPAATFTQSALISSGGWHPAQVNIKSTSKKPFEYYLRVTLNAKGGIAAVDDFQILNACPSLGSCDFEEDFCFWENVPTSAGSALWDRFTGRSHMVGPDVDHTFIHVRLLIVSDDSEEILLWERTSKKLAKSWIFQSIGVGRRKGHFRLAFEVDSPSSGGGLHFALDEINFVDCGYPRDDELSGDPCSQKDSFKCKSRQFCISSEKKCDLYDDCGDSSDEEDCVNERVTFDDEQSGVLEVGKPKRDDTEGSLQLQRGRSLSRKHDDTGPLFDHTTFNKSGAYLQFGGAYHGFNKMATLSSLTLQSGSCRVTFHSYMFGRQVRFWYNVHQRGVSLEVYRQTNLGDGGLSHVRTLPVTGPNYWNRADINFGTANETFRVVIKAVFTDNGALQGAAVDDITMTDGCRRSDRELPGKDTKNETSPSGQCGPEQLQCNDGGCYLPLQRCDFIPDCKDATDERDCGAADPKKYSSLCVEGEFLCADRKMCIPRSFVCDCESDCEDGSDETDC
ncbi:hypothetical protein V5799_008731, partial [Amblyomma americanum]